MSEPSVSILVVDDEDFADILADRFAAMGHDVDVARNGREGLDKIVDAEPDVVFLDLQMPEMDGMEVLEEIARRDVPSTVVVLTAYGTIPRAVQAMRCGAYDFLTKPIQLRDVERVLRHAIERHSWQTEKASLVEDVSRQFGEIVTQDPAFLGLIAEAERAARTDSTVLLLGESGTGKELLARRIHAASPRRERPFVVVNSVAIPESLFESELFGHEKGAFTGADRQRKGKLETAQGGTLFLDEIGDLSEATQAKLLRVLQEKEYHRVGGNRIIRADVRIVAATNRDLKQAVEAGRFRDDLYYRLNVLNFRLPPLRDRPADVPLLVDHFVRKFCREVKRDLLAMSEQAMNDLRAYGWPGNVRELANVIERVVVLAPEDVIGPDFLPEDVRPFVDAERSPNEATPAADPLDAGYHQAVRQYQRWLIREALARCEGRHNRAARLLQLNRSYLSRLRTQLGVR